MIATRLLDRLIPQPAETLSRPLPRGVFWRSLVAGLISTVFAGFLASAVGAMVAGGMTVGGGLLALLMLFQALLTLVIAPWSLSVVDASMGPRGELATRAALIPASAIASAIGAMVGVAVAATASPWGQPDRCGLAVLAWGVAGECSASVLFWVVSIAVAVAWWKTRRHQPALDRVVTMAVYPMVAATLLLCALGGVRIARARTAWHPPDMTHALRLYSPLLHHTARNWRPIDGDATSRTCTFVPTATELPLRAECTAMSCAVCLDDPSGGARSCTDGPRVNAWQQLRVLQDLPNDRVWLSVGDRPLWEFRRHDGVMLGTHHVTDADRSPPVGWVLFSLSTLALAYGLTRLRDARLAPWSRSESWRTAHMGDDRWLTFTDGAPPRQAASVFGAHHGEVVVVPTAEGNAGPFRSDGGVADGWVIPGTIAGLTDAVKAARTATNLYVLAVLAAGIGPWLGAAAMHMLSLR